MVTYVAMIGLSGKLQASDRQVRVLLKMKLVIIESPYAGNVSENLRYLRACMRDCLNRGEAPYASHALYTQEGVLDDLVPEERTLGIKAGFAWRQVAHLTAVYEDLGISPGMQYGIDDAKNRGVSIEYRTLKEWLQGRGTIPQPLG